MKQGEQLNTPEALAKQIAGRENRNTANLLDRFYAEADRIKQERATNPKIYGTLAQERLQRNR